MRRQSSAGPASHSRTHSTHHSTPHASGHLHTHGHTTPQHSSHSNSRAHHHPPPPPPYMPQPPCRCFETCSDKDVGEFVSLLPQFVTSRTSPWFACACRRRPGCTRTHSVRAQPQLPGFPRRLPPTSGRPARGVRPGRAAPLQPPLAPIRLPQYACAAAAAPRARRTSNANPLMAPTGGAQRTGSRCTRTCRGPCPAAIASTTSRRCVPPTNAAEIRPHLSKPLVEKIMVEYSLEMLPKPGSRAGRTVRDREAGVRPASADRGV